MSNNYKYFHFSNLKLRHKIIMKIGFKSNHSNEFNLMSFNLIFARNTKLINITTFHIICENCGICNGN